MALYYFALEMSRKISITFRLLTKQQLRRNICTLVLDDTFLRAIQSFVSWCSRTDKMIYTRRVLVVIAACFVGLSYQQLRNQDQEAGMPTSAISKNIYFEASDIYISLCDSQIINQYWLNIHFGVNIRLFTTSPHDRSGLLLKFILQSGGLLYHK